MVVVLQSRSWKMSVGSQSWKRSVKSQSWKTSVDSENSMPIYAVGYTVSRLYLRRTKGDSRLFRCDE